MANLKFKLGGAWYDIPTIKGDKGDAGDTLPAGGTAGQLLIKQSSVDNDATWQNNPTHDDRYYTETEVDAQVALLAPKANPTFTGVVTASGDIKSQNISLIGNRIEEHATNGLRELGVNYRGYNGGTTQFRDFAVFDGKESPIAAFRGPSKVLEMYGGIKFQVTQVPSADPNTLDDYEEGTFSVTLKNDLNEDFTISDQICYYTKIGNVVTVNITITTSNKPTSGIFIMCVGLPFNSKRYTAGTIGYASGTTDSNVSNLTLETSGHLFYLVYKNTSATGYSLLAPSQVSNTFHMEAISITYLTD